MQVHTREIDSGIYPLLELYQSHRVFSFIIGLCTVFTKRVHDVYHSSTLDCSSFSRKSSRAHYRRSRSSGIQRLLHRSAMLYFAGDRKTVQLQ
jgi:hypothetical protein